MKLRCVLPSSLLACALCATAFAQPSGEPGPGQPVSTETKPGKRYPWTYHRSDALDWTLTGVSAVGFMYVHFGVDPIREANWSSPILFDEDVRGWLRADSRDGRDTADKISDIFWFSQLGMPWADLAFPLLGDDWNWDTAWQMTSINIQAFAVSGFITRAGHRFVGRARPDVAECDKNPDYNAQCFGGSFASFPSGHTSTAAVGAGLVCAHHLEFGLLGNDVADGMVCGLSASLAVGTGVMRMVADRHYVSDVLAGSAIGFGSGLVLPLLRHYREEPASKDTGQLHWTVAPMAQGEDGYGLAAFGWF